MIKLKLKSKFKFGLKLKKPRTWKIIKGDCLAVLQSLQILPELDLGFDSLITDPPAGIGFMNKAWDKDKGGRLEWIAWLERIMRYAFRVLKPGAHGLIWALPRTSHWTATALENAGFEVRDIITHHFGTGFPKSNDVSKAIDRKANAKRIVIGLKRNNKGDSGIKTYAALGAFKQERFTKITTPVTDKAKRWAGWGTALKPASEHWILIRKPFVGTVARNVQKHGTGVLNVDGCRIKHGSEINLAHRQRQHVAGGNVLFAKATGTDVPTYKPTGRWPANVILSHAEDCDKKCVPGCPIRKLDKQSGISISIGGSGLASKSWRGDGRTVGAGMAGATGGFGDKGGASRFFYCSKPSRKERNAGLEGTNNHPTVKSKKLMSYLIKMITPPGGLVLDLFCGSGSTGVAAVENGWQFFGVEQDAAYVAMARDRIAAVGR